jgi:NADP-dependent 3-hydroxy acid dehydrogenase YdfG
MNFTGRRAVVTGGLSGIGEAVARRIKALGGEVAIWDQNGGIKTDIADWDSVQRAVDATMAQLGGIDILVNSAGIAGPTAPVTELAMAEWHRTIAINLNGTFFTNRAVVPQMITQNYGRIVNIASIAGKEGNPNASAYSASKAGVIWRKNWRSTTSRRTPSHPPPCARQFSTSSRKATSTSCCRKSRRAAWEQWRKSRTCAAGWPAKNVPSPPERCSTYQAAGRLIELTTCRTSIKPPYTRHRSRYPAR